MASLAANQQQALFPNVKKTSVTSGDSLRNAPTWYENLDARIDGKIGGFPSKVDFNTDRVAVRVRRSPMIKLPRFGNSLETVRKFAGLPIYLFECFPELLDSEEVNSPSPHASASPLDSSASIPQYPEWGTNGYMLYAGVRDDSEESEARAARGSPIISRHPSRRASRSAIFASA